MTSFIIIAISFFLQNHSFGISQLLVDLQIVSVSFIVSYGQDVPSKYVHLQVTDGFIHLC